MKKKLVNGLCLLALSLGSTSCVTVRSENTGCCFYSADDGWCSYHENVRETMMGGLGKLTEDQVYEIYGPPQQIMLSPYVKAVGWAYDHTSGTGLDLAILSNESKLHSKFMMTCAFNNEGVLVDYYTWSSQKPTEISTFRTQPIIQALVAARAVYLLSDLLEDTLFRAESKARAMGAEVEQKIKDYVKDKEKEVRDFLEN